MNQSQWRDIILFFTLPISLPMAILIQKTPFGKLGDYLPYRPRFLNFIWAMWGGYFWSHCIICHKYYGGHEHGNSSLMYSWSTGTVVCRKCAPLAEQVNLQNMLKMMPDYGITEKMEEDENEEG